MPQPRSAEKSRTGHPGRFVQFGRRKELDWLRYCADEACAGRPRTVLVSGEPGIGKTHLVRSSLEVARRAGMAVGLCRGYEDLPIPYMPFIELVQSLQRDCAKLDGEVDPAISPLSLFEGNGSGLSGVTNSIAGTGSGQDDASQARFFVSVSTRIIEIAEKDTLRVGEDDVPVSDPVDSITGVEHAVVVRLLAEGNPRP